MSLKTRPQRAYGLTAPTIFVANPPIIANRDPNANDKYDLGQEWINTLTNAVFTLTSFVAGVPTWTDITGGAGIFNNLTVTNAFTVQNGPTHITSTVAGAGTISLTENASAASTIVIHSVQSTQNGAINLEADAGGITLTAATRLTLVSDQAAATGVTINANGNAATGITINTGTGGFVVNSNGILNAGFDGNSNITVTGGNLVLASVGNDVIINSNDASVDAILLHASNAAGGVTFTTGSGGINGTSVGGPIDLDGQTASHITVTGAIQDLTLSSVGGSVNITGTEAAIDAIALSAPTAGGGINISASTGGVGINTTGSLVVTTAGRFAIQGLSVTAAASTVVNGAYMGQAIFTGQNVVAGAAATFTITNASVAATSMIMATAYQTGVATNADLIVRSIVPGAGTFNVVLFNAGGTDVTGNSIVINFMAMTV